MELTDLPPVPGVAHRSVRVGDVVLHVAEAGEGAPLVLLHGWPQHWWCWRKVIPTLAERYHVIAPDLRGWGWSEAPPGSYDKRTFAEDIRGLLDAEGIERARVIGHDWGGYTAFLLALEHPERVERMVTLDIPPPWRSAQRPRYVQLPALLSYQLTLATPGLGPRTMTSGKGFIRALLKAGSGSGMQWSDEELDAYAEVLREPARARASSACYRTFLTREMPASLSQGATGRTLEVPTLLVMGGAGLLQRVLRPQPGPNLQVEEIPGAGHFLAEERPDEVLARALPFLDAA